MTEVRCVKMDWETALRHLGGRVEDEREIRDGIDMMDATLFQYRREKDGVPVWCTACRKESRIIVRGRHGQAGVCPACGQKGLQLDVGRGRGRRCAEDLYTVWRKSAVDASTICAVTYWLLRDDSVKDPRKAEPAVHPVQVSVFTWGKGGARFTRRVQWLFLPRTAASIHAVWQTEYAIEKDFSWMTEMKPACTNTLTNCDRTECVKSLLATMRGTPFLRAWDENFLSEPRMETLLGVIARYPTCEYLVKLGLWNLVSEKANGYAQNLRRYRAVNWKGQSLKKVLGVTRGELRAAMSAGTGIDSEMLLRHDILRMNGCKVALSDVRSASKGLPYNLFSYAGRVEYIAGVGQDVLKAARYVTKQKCADSGILEDYWRDLQQLGENMADERRLYPRNLLESHRQTHERVKILADELQEAALEKRLPVLEKRYGFAAEGLVLRPLRTVQEVINEGKALHHCVGSYAKRYAEGYTDLCALRAAESPNRPLFTVELSPKTGTMIQCRGDRNMTPPEWRERVDAFWRAWNLARKGRCA